MRKSWQMTYEVFLMFVMASYAVLIFTTPKGHPWLTSTLIFRVDIGLTTAFAIEYIVRLYLAEEKLKFILHNWFDLIAIIPIDRHMVLTKVFRFVRLLRIITASPFVRTLMQVKALRNLLSLLVAVIFWSSGAIYLLEHTVNPTIKTYGDALWWAIVTVTTVGYGDVYPITAAGRVVAAFLMLFSIAFVAIFATELATHWKQFRKGSNNLSNKRKERIRAKLDSIGTIDKKTADRILDLLDTSHRETTRLNEKDNSKKTAH